MGTPVSTPAAPMCLYRSIAAAATHLKHERIHDTQDDIKRERAKVE